MQDSGTIINPCIEVFWTHLGCTNRSYEVKSSKYLVSDVHTFPPVVFSHTFVGFFQGQVMLIRLQRPVNSANGLMSLVLIQHLPVENKSPLKLLAVEQPVSHLETSRPGLEISTPFWILDFLRLHIYIPGIIRPGFGRAKRLCVRVTGVGAIAGHFHCLFTNALLSVDLQPYLSTTTSGVHGAQVRAEL